MSKMMLSVLVSMLAYTQANVELCGEYVSTCQEAEGSNVNAAGALNGTLSMEGNTGGTFAISLNRFNNLTECLNDQQFFSASMIGNFFDYGGAMVGQDFDRSLRKVMMNVTFLTATPMSDDAVAVLGDACPCNDRTLWVVGQRRTIIAGSAGTLGCSGLSVDGGCDLGVFLGGTDELDFLSPIFGVFHEENDTSITRSTFSSLPGVGWIQDANTSSFPLWQNFQRTHECTATPAATLCGVYNTVDLCELTINPYNLTVVGSEYTDFKFRGPLGPAGSQTPPVDTYGVYNRTKIFYSDTNCNIPLVQVAEYGSMGVVETGGPNENFVVNRQASNYLVTPMSDFGAKYLEDHCPCGPHSDNNWKQGTARLLTTCPGVTCEKQYWNDWMALGSNLYAYATRNSTFNTYTNKSFTHMVFSRWNTTMANLYNQETIYPLELSVDANDLCSSATYSRTYCGSFRSECTTDENPFYDAISDITISGVVDNTTASYAVEGRIDYNYEYFEAGKTCDSGSRVVTVESAGYFTVDSNAEVVGVEGVKSIEADLTSYTITPYTDDYVKILNDPTGGCPCNGSWSNGQSRTITSCAAGTCSSDWVQATLPGQLGYPSFGTIQLSNIDNGLRISDLQIDPVDGYTTPFGPSTTISYQNGACPTYKNDLSTSVLDGCWFLDCHPLSGDQSDYEVNGYIDLAPGSTEGDLFSINKTLFPRTSGCSDLRLRRSLLSFYTTGEFSLNTSADQTAIKDGKVLTFAPYTTIITPNRDEGTKFLTDNCPTCGMFATGIPKTFGVGVPCDCIALENAVGFLAGSTGYGVVKSYVADADGSFKGAKLLRFSQFSQNLPSRNLQFSKDNGEYSTIDEKLCPLFGFRPEPKSSMAGGDVVILLFFMGLISYCGIGMVLNYRRTGGISNGGTPVIPHVSFWRSVPGLVGDGFRFTFCQLCGLKKSGSTSYQAFGISNSSSEGDYGAL